MARVIAHVVFALLYVSFALAQETPVAAPTILKDPQAIAVVQKTIAAMGGPQALLTYQDSQASGSLTIYGGAMPIKYPITLKTKGTQETRAEVGMVKGTNVRILNHGQAIIQKADGWIMKLSESNTLNERVNHIPLLSILSQYQDSNVNVQYQQTTQLGSQECDVLAVGSLSPIASAQTMFFVNRVTGLVRKIQYTETAENDASNTQNVEVYFDDYRSVDGISVPFHHIFYTDGNIDSEIILSSLSFNVGLSDDEFALPAGGASVQ